MHTIVGAGPREACRLLPVLRTRVAPERESSHTRSGGQQISLSINAGACHLMPALTARARPWEHAGARAARGRARARYSYDVQSQHVRPWRACAQAQQGGLKAA